MPRSSNPHELKLHERSAENGVQSGPNNSPMNMQGVDLDRPFIPQSPPASPKQHNRDSSKNFLSNFKSKKVSDSEHKREDRDEYRPTTSSVSKIYHLRNNPGSTPELSLVGSQENIGKDSLEGEKSGPPVRPQPTPHYSQDGTTGARHKDKKENKSVFRMHRTRSIRRGSSTGSRPSNSTINGLADADAKGSRKGSLSLDHDSSTGHQDSDWPGAESRSKKKGKGEKRGKSEERGQATDSQENLSSSLPRSSKDPKSGGSFMTGIGNKARHGGGKIGGFLRGIGRGNSQSTVDRQVPDSEYVIKVINLPLVEQTRATRISKDLASCRDKTEYWMPALPWRCIDYLNTNCENEGLYRIPGSGPQVKYWQRRFDTELDIDLLSEDVIDTNEIASMLKAWFRELPTEIMPHSLQKSLAAELEKVNPNYRNQGQEAPQLLRDALSELSPFNYYLLFAITCHLSLLLTNKDLNKMDLNNLAVCVGPCLNLDRWLFNYLVGDWRHCWQGCFTEKEYLQVEKLIEEGHDPKKLPTKRSADAESLTNSLWASTIGDDATDNMSMTDDRALSSGSSKPDSKYEKAASHHDQLQRNNHSTPLTYLPAGTRSHGNGNGTHGLGVEQDFQRPATSQGSQPDGMNGIQQPPPITNKSRSNSTTPRLGHNRSRSDLPGTAAKTNADYGYPVRPPSRPPSRQSGRRG